MKTFLNIVILAGYGAVLWLGLHPGAPDTAPAQESSVTALLQTDAERPAAEAIQTQYYAPRTLRERVASAAEACFSGWGEIEGLGRVTPQGGAPLAGSTERYGCVGTHGTNQPVYAVMDYAGGDRTRADGYVITALCDGDGTLLIGSDAALCLASPL